VFPFHLSFSYRRSAIEASYDIKRLSWSCTLPLSGESESAAPSSVSLSPGTWIPRASSPQGWRLVLSLWGRPWVRRHARTILWSCPESARLLPAGRPWFLIRLAFGRRRPF
jgi:hypothetical protein